MAPFTNAYGMTAAEHGAADEHFGDLCKDLDREPTEGELFEFLAERARDEMQAGDGVLASVLSGAAGKLAAAMLARVAEAKPDPVAVAEFDRARHVALGMAESLVLWLKDLEYSRDAAGMVEYVAGVLAGVEERT